MPGEQWSEPSVTDNDRLPWLETAGDENDGAPSLGRVVGLVLVGLVALGAVLGGIYWFKHRSTAPGDGTLIAAPAGDYKVKPDDPGGMKVAGEGDAAVAASGGAAGGNGSIAVNSLPEAPIVGKKAGPDTKSGAGASTATASVAGPGGKLTAPPPGRPVTIPNGGGGGALVQLGSFPSEASANTAWAQASKRFGYLAGLGKSIEKAEVNGRVFYRLKVNAGSAGAAQELCGKLKVAGEACIVTS
ncbi:MAG: SPOR domain-containing protein [Sphingomonas sp.]|uniref:SPOR domain-containing protein n=1 Tax=Sphingomonas sp. TaxID=28214 RepID=UPI001ACBFA95|nr:SPOR domain-containing protein [Sphingomonas sp.]MBN8814242.1 SPOR domain-containing protein [Sphingomonas sp.]